MNPSAYARKRYSARSSIAASGIAGATTWRRWWTRHASVRFVTSAFDRIDSRGAFLDLAGRAGVPILAVYGDETPRKSLAEMDALSTVPGVDIARLRRGKPCLHEEFAVRSAGNPLGFVEPLS